MIPFIKFLERFLMRFFIEDHNKKDVSEPKYLNPAVLKFPGSAISALINESKYLYKNSVFEIVAHALNIHRSDIKSDEKLKTIVKNSKEDLEANVEDLYYSKVKTIYGEIIKYASNAQSTLNLNRQQNGAISDVKVANRKMVEIIKDARELNKNIRLVRDITNEALQNEYDSYRKKIIKVLRVVYLFRTENDSEKYALKLKALKAEAKANIRQSNKSIDKLIRKNLITAEMASSLFNDYTNVNDMIKKLIDVAELLYGKMDSLLEENDNHKKTPIS